MGLSADLISQFVRLNNDTTKKPKETIVYGVVKAVDASGKPTRVQLDGASGQVNIEGGESEFTPVSSTVNANVGDRVTVTLKNHTATVTGNLTSPSTTVVYVKDMTSETDKKVNEFEKKIANYDTVIAKKANAEELYAAEGRIGELEADNVEIHGTLDTYAADIETLKTSKLTANEADLKYAKIEQMTSANSEIATLKTKYAEVEELKTQHGEFKEATVERLEAAEGNITDLKTDRITATEANARFANLDFSNIGEAAIKKILADSGLIENITVGDGTITGQLVGVTISGDLIEGNTIVAEKLVIKGDDGLYYKLNTDGISTESEQTDYNSLNGSVIKAKSITATKISVDDLVAFDATIGGFNISENAIYSGVKASSDNTTQGIYLDREGQLSLGDGDNYIRYFKNEEGVWKLEISAESILFGKDSKSSASDIKALTEHVKIGTYTDPETDETQPCVELSEGDSDFKQVITNTKTVFMDGSVERTKIDGDGIKSNNVAAEEELRVGGFAWKVRSNGNLGLVWKGGSK